MSSNDAYDSWYAAEAERRAQLALDEVQDAQRAGDPALFNKKRDEFTWCKSVSNREQSHFRDRLELSEAHEGLRDKQLELDALTKRFEQLEQDARDISDLNERLVARLLTGQDETRA